MSKKPTYEELEQRVEKFENETTELKRVEEALRESEGKFRILSDQALLGIIILQEELFVYVNDRAAAIMEVTAEEVANWSLGDYAKLIHPDDLAFVMEQGRKKQTGKKGAVIHYNWRMVTPGGNLKWIEMWSKTIPFASRTADMVTMIDISERKLAEESLRESESLHHLYFDNASDVIYSVDPEFKIINISPSVERMLGYKPEELIDRSFQELNLVAPEYLEQAASDTMRVLGGERISSAVYQFIARDGKKKWGEVSGAPLIRDGQIVALVSVARDITKRKQAEEALRESEERFKVIATNTPDHLLMQDKDLRYVWVLNPQLGLTEEDMIGKTDFDFLSKDDAAFLTEIKRKVLRTGNPEFVKVPLASVEGDVQYFEGSYIPKRDQKGENDGLIGYFRNVTERKKSEDLMSKSNALLTSVINQAPFAIHILEGDFKNIRVVIENAESARIMGEVIEGRTGINADIPEMLTTRFFSIDGKQEVPLSQMPSPRAFQGEVVTNEEFIFSHADGTQIMVEASASPIYNADNQIIAVAVIFQDITERKKAEKEQEQLRDQLAQSQKMEAVGTLSGGIAHDFNNILAIILGNAELAFDDVPEGNPATENLVEIRQASIRAKEMVRQLLSFSRKSAQKRAPLNLVPIIKESMKMLRTAIPTSVEFSVQISDEPCNIMGDASQINQIMMNLTTNATHAMSKEGGLLEVTLKNIVLLEEKPCFDGVLSPGAYTRLKIRDTGTGMAPETMARIFEPYYTTKDVGKGTGMGLSVIHGIIKVHLGGILVESELGKGTHFEIYFPTLKDKVEEKKTPEGKIKGGTEKILFVDDEASIVKLNHQRLERLGYQVKSTQKPEEALDWFRADPDHFDIIITDMTMPGMTGDKLTAEILRIRPQMPVIICTGYSEKMSEKDAEALGVSKYLEKPITAQSLTAALREVLEKK